MSRPDVKNVVHALLEIGYGLSIGALLPVCLAMGDLTPLKIHQIFHGSRAEQDKEIKQ